MITHQVILFLFWKNFSLGSAFLYLSSLSWPLRGGYQVAHLLTRRRVSHFPTHQDFPISRARISSNSRSGFTKNLQFICPLIGWPRQTRENVPCLENIDVKVEWMNQIRNGTKCGKWKQNDYILKYLIYITKPNNSQSSWCHQKFIVNTSTSDAPYFDLHQSRPGFVLQLGVFNILSAFLPTSLEPIVYTRV